MSEKSSRFRVGSLTVADSGLDTLLNNLGAHVLYISPCGSTE